MTELQNLVGVTILVGMAAGLAFGNIAHSVINEVAKRRRRERAYAAWDKAWRSPR